MSKALVLQVGRFLQSARVMIGYNRSVLGLVMIGWGLGGACFAMGMVAKEESFQSL